jgi:hypothetical protein
MKIKVRQFSSLNNDIIKSEIEFNDNHDKQYDMCLMVEDLNNQRIFTEDIVQWDVTNHWSIEFSEFQFERVKNGQVEDRASYGIIRYSYKNGFFIYPIYECQFKMRDINREPYVSYLYWQDYNHDFYGPDGNRNFSWDKLKVVGNTRQNKDLQKKLMGLKNED